ncbi:hypothetical protein JTE90_002326 [Oedothorax gibbosus]|uniref:Uncharacterized protein n=1 Tax=Oedothorax gibbosus TaxID=931172 RepID=A0AAV6ULB3_9ARAC|nr:hypothetical protein JTE90_002326 [Oedothorax gibbosus]
MDGRMQNGIPFRSRALHQLHGSARAHTLCILIVGRAIVGLINYLIEWSDSFIAAVESLDSSIRTHPRGINHYRNHLIGVNLCRDNPTDVF